MSSSRPLAALAFLILFMSAAACADEPTSSDAAIADAGQLADAAAPDADTPDADTPDADGPDLGSPDAVASLALHSGSAGGAGNLDGPRRQARFSGPGGIARAPDGTVYVADSSNLTIRRISPAGEVTTLAGASGKAGGNDGRGAAARFELPAGLALAPNGDLIVSDSYAGTLRRVTPDGVVSTWAGRHGEPGNVDGNLSQARFRAPEGMTFDLAGNLYVADREAHTIRRITPAGQVSTFVGTDLTPGSSDGPAGSALLDTPFAIAAGPNGSFAIADSGNNVIRVVDGAGQVSTLAGTPGAGQDTSDGSGPDARFGRPRALVFQASGALLVADTFNDRLREVTPAGVVSTWAGSFAGSKDGPLLEAQLSFPSALVLSEEGGEAVLYVADTGSSIIRRAAAGRLETYAGTAVEVGLIDGRLTDARYFGPSGLLLRADGSLLVADAFNNALRQASNDALITLAGDPSEGTVVNGPLSVARFQSPRAFLDDPEGGYWLADAGNNQIRHVSAGGEVSTFAGGINTRGQTMVDGPLLDARFMAPGPMVRSSAGVIYVSDSGNHAIRRIRPNGVVDTLAGDGLPDYIEGAGDTARFNGPDGLLLIDDQTLIVSDALNHVLRKLVISNDGTAQVSLFAGTAPVNGEPRPGDRDGLGAAAAFNTPRGLLRDGAAILVADSNNSLLRRVQLADAQVSTVAGTRGRFGVAPGPLPGVLFEPQALLRLPDGGVMITSFGALLTIQGL